MADMDFKGYLTVFLILSLFMVAMVSFGSGIFSEYGKSGNFIDETKVNVSNMEYQANLSNQYTDTAVDTFKNDNLGIATGTLVVTSIWGVIGNMLSSVSVILDLFITFSQDVLGIPTFALGSLITIIMIGMIFAGWKVLRTGE